MSSSSTQASNNDRHMTNNNNNKHNCDMSNGRSPSSYAEAPMDDVLNSMIGAISTSTTSSSSLSSNLPRFMPSSTFAGPKDGYVFATRNGATGYYLDGSENIEQDNQQQSVAPSKKRRRTIQFADDDDQNNVAHDDDLNQKVAHKKTGEELLAEAETAQEEAMAQLQKITSSNSRRGGNNHQTNISTSDPQSVLRACNQLHKSISQNRELRSLHYQQPEKFMESELRLNEDVMLMRGVAADVGLYPQLCKNSKKGSSKGISAMESMCRLLSHENVDIALSAIGTLVEWMDVDLLVADNDDENQDLEKKQFQYRQNMGRICRELIDRGGLDLVVSNFGRLEEGQSEEDDSGIDSILILLESLLELDALNVISATIQLEQPYGSVASRIFTGTTLLTWLFQRSSKRDSSSHISNLLFSPIKLHASEVLSTLLQHEDARHLASHISNLPPFQVVSFDDNEEERENKLSSKRDKHVNGIEVLLQSIAVYRKSDPQSDEECEYLENLMNALAALLLPSTNTAILSSSSKQQPAIIENNNYNISKSEQHNSDNNYIAFLESQGIELMMRCLRERVHSGHGALRILTFCLGNQNKKNLNIETAQLCNGNNKNNYAACEIFVDAGGFKLLFPLLMGRSTSIPKPASCSDAGKKLLNNKKKGSKLSKLAKRQKKAKKEWMEQITQNTIYILYYLLQYINSGDNGDDSKMSSCLEIKNRLLAKFLESDFEKSDRLVELLLRYDTQSRIAEKKFYISDEAEYAENHSEELEVELMAFHEKLKGGGDLFHRVGSLLAFVSGGSKRCHAHILEQLRLKGSGIGVVKAAVSELISILEDGLQKSHLEKLLAVL